jgi:hypothetical protein
MSIGLALIAASGEIPRAIQDAPIATLTGHFIRLGWADNPANLAVKLS